MKKWLAITHLRRFRKDENGSATVEAILWLPLFFLILALAVDASMLFYAHNRVTKVMQDVNRSLSVNRIQSTTAAQSRILALLADYPNATAATVVDTNGIINSRVTVPAGDVLVLDFVPLLRSVSINVQAQHYLEQ
ncbi:TadE/TadG family type IV pilus assembly protein [Ostreiculturibacter nitratireducens]|uniref:TadE/TadG family type IV pilus assembly protein n=1 Tax=Ostreiculturibacter nitratireducens TaxID=3075226 RepID=UPI0031B59413